MSVSVTISINNAPVTVTSSTATGNITWADVTSVSPAVFDVTVDSNVVKINGFYLLLANAKVAGSAAITAGQAYTYSQELTDTNWLLNTQVTVPDTATKIYPLEFTSNSEEFEKLVLTYGNILYGDENVYLRGTWVETSSGSNLKVIQTWGTSQVDDKVRLSDQDNNTINI